MVIDEDVSKIERLLLKFVGTVFAEVVFIEIVLFGTNSVGAAFVKSYVIWVLLMCFIHLFLLSN